MPASLKEVLAAADPVKKRQVLQSLSQHLIPIMGKGLVDSQLSHRCVCICGHHSTVTRQPELMNPGGLLCDVTQATSHNLCGSDWFYVRAPGHWWDLHAG